MEPISSLGAQGLVRPARAEREEHVPARLGRQAGDRAGQEQLGSGDRVRRVGAGHVEPAGQAAGQRAAQVVLDQLGVHPGARDLLADPGQHVGIGVDHGQPLDAAPRPPVPANAAIATEIRSSSPSSRIRRPDQRPGLVHPQHPPDLRADRAVRLVQLRLGAREPRPPRGPAGRPARPARRGRRARCRRSPGTPRSGPACRRRAGPGRPGSAAPAGPGRPRRAGAARCRPRRRSGPAARPCGSRRGPRTGSLRAMARRTSLDPGPALGQPDGRRDLGDH